MARVHLFIQFMTFLPAYRSLFYLRSGLPGKFLSIFCRPVPTFAVRAKRIGAGLTINHGHGTLISTDEIGENCWIGQLVTIGFNNGVGPPTIGNNVTIHVGATIVGKVRIGDNSIVGANSLVLCDVPPGVTVLGVPAKIIARTGCSAMRRRRLNKTYKKVAIERPRQSRSRRAV